MNVASRMESTSLSNVIQMSRMAAELLLAQAPQMAVSRLAVVRMWSQHWPCLIFRGQPADDMWTCAICCSIAVPAQTTDSVRDVVMCRIGSCRGIH